MELLCYLALATIVCQLAFSLFVFSTCRYAVRKFNKKRHYMPAAAVIIPCKGKEHSFIRNISSFFSQDYDNYRLIFVVADKSDPAYYELCRLKEELSSRSRAVSIDLLIAGAAVTCSQKVHNLLCGVNSSGSSEVIAFADSDVCVRPDWLSHLVYPLRKSKNGASSGYRWFIPEEKNLASLAISALNAKVAQLLGNTRFNQIWGGSMAIRADVFRDLGIGKLWLTSLSDDLSLSWAIKKANLKVAFVPACLAGSYESTDWEQLFEFARRQFVITRVARPRVWLLGLFGTLLSVLGLWGGIALSIYTAHARPSMLPVFVALSVTVFVSQLSRAVLRQIMISRLLSDKWRLLRSAALIDILFFWAWSILLLIFILSSAFSRTIIWRGIRYKLISPTETVILKD